MNIAFIRIDPRWIYHLERNPALSQEYKMYIGQVTVPDEISSSVNKGWDFIFHKADKIDAAKARAELKFWFEHHHITHVVTCQRLLWYSEMVESLCQELNLPLTWCELFFDNRIIMDRSGLQYCEKNDLHFESVGTLEDPLFPSATRWTQPELAAPTLLYKACRVESSDDDVVIVLGQTPYDMSLREYPQVCYEQWMDDLFNSNPKTKFMFKHHPSCETLAAKRYPNVFDIHANLVSLFNAFDRFASYSSTTIFEGLIRRKKFVTGGYHFCSGKGLTIEPGITGTYLSGITEQLKAHVIPEEALQRRLWFICNRYTVPLSSPRLVDRITLSSEEFFK
jgi:hypothetical protein